MKFPFDHASYNFSWKQHAVISRSNPSCNNKASGQHFSHMWGSRRTDVCDKYTRSVLFPNV